MFDFWGEEKTMEIYDLISNNLPVNQTNIPIDFFSMASIVIGP